ILQEMRIPNCSIYTQPAVHRTQNGKISFACLPGLNRSNIVSQDEYKGMQPQAVHQLMTEKITQLTQGMLAQCDQGFRILLGHLTYSGTDTGFDDLMMEN